MARNQSWLELLDSSNSASDSLLSPKRLSLEFPDDNDTTRERSFEIELLDKSNEQKFENLLQQQKLKSPMKSPYKRKLEPEAPTKVDTPSRQKEKRSKLDIENADKRNETLEEGEILDISGTANFKKRIRSESSDASSSNGSSSGLFENRGIETDKGTLERRQKQIDYGKNTVGYDNYLTQVPKFRRTRDHPKTPPKHLKYSRRAWEGLVKAWRKKLHTYDPQDADGLDKDDDNATF